MVAQSRIFRRQGWQRGWTRLLGLIERYAGAALGIAAIGVIVLGTWHLIASEQAHTERSAQRMLANLATVFEEDTHRVLGAADRTLGFLRDSYLKDPDHFDIKAWARLVQAATDVAFQTSIIGPDGVLKGSNLPSEGIVDLADREHFRVHRDRLVDGLFVSKPINGRVSKRWSIQVTRRIDNLDGSFGGVAVVSVDPGYFAKFYGSIDLGNAGSVMLVGTDGIIRARKTATAFDTGTSLQGTILFKSVAKNPKSGIYVVTKSRTDGVGRMVAYRSVRGTPLIVTVSSGLSDIFAIYEANKRRYILLAVLCCICIFGVTLLILRYQRNLGRAKEEAEAGTRARSAFLAAMSHEIRTPMNAVLGLAQSLVETPLSKEQKHSVTAINSAGGHLLRILNDILDFSKMEAGQLQLERTTFSPEIAAANVLSVIGPRAQAKGVAIKLECASDVPATVEGDAGRVGQVLMNLLSNAAKFTEKGEITVRVECLCRGQGLAAIRWSVSDTGIGIAADRLKHLFREFVQADSSIARRFGGSGLGLAICKRLAWLMGGEIGVESQQGKGSTFWFRLTLPEAEATEARAEPAAAEITKILVAAIEKLGRPARVLIAEDNATNQMVVAKMLEGLDIALTVVADGAEAVGAAVHFPFDVVFMDMCMPNMDGLQATAAIRARGGTLATLPIIALSANIFPEDIKACRDAGMTDFLGKPVRKRELIKAIVQALVGGQQTACALFSAASTPAGATEAVAGPAAAVTVPADTPPAPAIAPEKLTELAAEIGAEGVVETLRIYIAETEARLCLLQALSCQVDRAKIRVEAHTLKGASAAFGLAHLSALAFELERSAPDITAARYRETVQRLQAAFAAGRSELADRLEVPPAT